MASAIIVRQGGAPGDFYRWHVMGLASNWENAKRICELEAAETITWDSDEHNGFGVILGEGMSGRKYRLDFYRIGTRNDFQFPDGY
jgi:hypothetical protein